MTVTVTGTAERDDAALVAAVADGDREAFAELYRRHVPWLRASGCAALRRPELVDEAVQDTFVAVWRAAGRWDGRGEVAAWIWGIGIRRLVDALRRGPAAGRRADGVRTASRRRPRSRCCSPSSTATWRRARAACHRSCGLSCRRLCWTG